MIAINRMVFNHGLFKLSYVASFDTNGRPLVISDKKKFEIEKEIENELNNCYVEAKSIISSKINLLKVILKELIKKETLNKDEFSNILNSNN
jgi:ATP-dependent Zn protease